MTESTHHTAGQSDITLTDLWNWVSEARVWIASIGLFGASIGATYAFVSQSWYQAEVTVLPASNRGVPAIGTQLGGLASLAGLSLGSTSNSEPVAVVRSGEFTRLFIEQNNLLPLLFANRWDEGAGRWKRHWLWAEPDWRDGVRLFENSVRSISEDKKTNLVTISVEWKDPELAASWANSIVDLLNDQMRQRALIDAERNVAFLRQELATATVVPLQQSIGRLLEGELQKLMLARGNREFSFRVIDRATPPKWRSRPSGVRSVVTGLFLGALLGLFLSIYRRQYLSRR